MHKHKQKAKKHHFNLALRKPVLAGIAVMLVATPASWLMVSAHPAINDNAGLRAGQSSQGQAGDVAANSTGSATGTSATTNTSNGTTKASSNAKAAQNAKKAASGSTKSGDKATTGSTSTSKATPSSVPPKPQPAPAPTPVTPLGTHDNIISTIFWVGEPADASNANISNAESAWDGNWQTHFGGFDDPDHRNGYNPAAFTPNENPFYFALPYNDLDGQGHRKASANNCPNTGASVSWCKNAWIKVTKGSKTAYAQWQDVGPLQEDDTAYVFGSSAPKNTWGAKAGLDVSPAVRDYLGLGDVDRVGWSFVSASSVPGGPWKNIVTTSPGGW